MSAARSGTLSWLARFTWMIHISLGQRSGSEVSALQESKDRRVRGEDPIPVGVACHPSGGKEGRHGGRREERVDADVLSKGRERLEGSVEHIDRSDQQGRTVRSVERREGLEVEMPDEERAQVGERRARDVLGRKLREDTELQRRRARGEARQDPSLDETQEPDGALVEGDFSRRLRGEVLPAGQDPVFDGRRVPVGLLQDARPRERRGEGAAGGAAQADDLVPVVNVRAEQGLERPGDERALAPATLAGDRNTRSSHVPPSPPHRDLTGGLGSVNRPCPCGAEPTSARSRSSPLRRRERESS